MTPFVPISINLRNRKVLVVGGGNVALLKSSGLNRFTDNITILAPEIKDELKEYPFRFIYKTYEGSDLEGYFMVYACTNDRLLNERIRKQCHAKQILMTICDNPAESDFVNPAICKIEDITIAIGTNGKSPKQSVAIRNQIQELIEKGVLKIK